MTAGADRIAQEDPLLRLIRGESPRLAAERWESLAKQAAREGLAGLVLTLLERSGRIDDMPAPARQVLERDLDAIRASQAILFHRFGNLAGCLQGAGVPFLVHKGAAIAPLVYDRMEDRPMVDIDIVFRPAHWRQVREALGKAGYRMPEGAMREFWLENYFNLAVTSPEDPPSSFDLHWSLTQKGRYHVDIEGVFSRAVTYTLDGRSLLRLGDEDLLLSLFLHLAYHYFEARLLWLHDMKLIMERRRIDWDVLLSRASEWGLTAVVGFNLQFLEKIFPGAAPPEVAARARIGRVRRILVKPFLSRSPRHLFRGENRRLNQLLLGLAAIDRPSDAGSFAFDKVTRSLKWVGRGPRRR